MFLSMVSAPRDGRSIRAMADADTQRRFNVAASRAQDQLYLFHTATLADLNPTCMRYQLLQYCLDPQVAVPDVAGLDLSELERLAFQVHREPGNQPDPFESWFELDVFLSVARRGYRAIPQFEIAGCGSTWLCRAWKGAWPSSVTGTHGTAGIATKRMPRASAIWNVAAGRSGAFVRAYSVSILARHSAISGRRSRHKEYSRRPGTSRERKTRGRSPNHSLYRTSDPRAMKSRQVSRYKAITRAIRSVSRSNPRVGLATLTQPPGWPGRTAPPGSHLHTPCPSLCHTTNRYPPLSRRCSSHSARRDR